MPTNSPSLAPSDSRLKWRKRKRQNSLQHQKLTKDDEDEDEVDEEEEAEDAPAAAAEAEDDSPAAADPILDLRQSEVLSDNAQRISDFPEAFRRTVNRPHPSVLALDAAKSCSSNSSAAASRSWSPPFLENISHGQLQALSAVLSDHSSLQLPELDRASAYVCSPPPLMEGKGVVKRFSKEKLFLVPVHSEWFLTSSVNRLERQVVPHFFSGKSADHTPERYMLLRNKIIGKYLENPGKRLSLADCQGLVPSSDLYDLSRIVRFLDNWGIINYLAASSVHRGLRMAGSLLREDSGGELQLQTSPLRSIDSLILFDRPKCSLRLEDVAHLSSSSVSSAAVNFDSGALDLDSRIRERLAEHSCNYCSRPLLQLHYQSQKEADVMLCSDCFNDAKFVTGHSSLDFVRVDSQKDNFDFDGDIWTDEETLLLLEAIEKYNDNWNEIAEYVGTKSKAQCILHFVQLPMEDGLLENIELPHMAGSCDALNGHEPHFQNSDSNGVDHQDLNCGSQIPFANSANPLMSLVAFLTSAIGPRVAASCARAVLSVLTRGDSISRSNPESTSTEVGLHGLLTNLGHQKDGNLEVQLPHSTREAIYLLTPEHVKYAAMCGLSAAATKAKLFADQEEREIQRLAATIINHQLKRLELKLKQFAEIETLLLKECEQAERMRQRLSAERIRMMSARFGQPGITLPAGGGTAAAASAATAATATVVHTTLRQPTVPVTVIQQPNVSSAYGNNIVGQHQMPFMQRQQAFSFGPRLPLSAIHPSPPGSSQNIVFNSGMANTSAGNNHPLLRSSPGNNSNVG